MKQKQSIDIDQAYRTFKQAHAQDRLGPNTNDASIAAILAGNIRQGEKMIVLKQFKAGGRKYANGDEFIYSGQRLDHVVSLARGGYLIPVDVWQRSQKYQADKNRAAEAEALYQDRQRLQADLASLQQERSATAARLAALEGELQGAEQRIANVEQDLLPLLTGE